MVASRTPRPRRSNRGTCASRRAAGCRGGHGKAACCITGAEVVAVIIFLVKVVVVAMLRCAQYRISMVRSNSPVKDFTDTACVVRFWGSGSVGSPFEVARFPKLLGCLGTYRLGVDLSSIPCSSSVQMTLCCYPFERACLVPTLLLSVCYLLATSTKPATLRFLNNRRARKFELPSTKPRR